MACRPLPIICSAATAWQPILTQIFSLCHFVALGDASHPPNTPLLALNFADYATLAAKRHYSQPCLHAAVCLDQRREKNSRTLNCQIYMYPENRTTVINQRLEVTLIHPFCWLFQLSIGSTLRHKPVLLTGLDIK